MRRVNRSGGVETMASVGDMPWGHDIGVKVSNKMTPEQMLKAAKCDWTVSLRPMAYKNAKGAWVEDRSKLKLVRDSDDYPLTTCGTGWKPVQNLESAGFFKKFVSSGHMNMEHMGSLDHGRYLWALANINRDFAVGSKGSDDEIKNYLLMIQPHVKGKAMVFKYMSIRSWCWNSLQYLLGSSVGRKGVTGGGFRMPHSIAFNDATKRAAEEALGLAVKQTDELKEAVQLLAKARAGAKQIENFFCDVLKFDPKDVGKDDVREPRMLSQLRDALDNSPGAALPSAKGTWWGAVNAVTYVVDHELGRDRSKALRSAWLGPKANLKQRALSLAIEAAR